MNERPSDVNPSWEQLPLFDLEAVELRLRVGTVTSADHLQVQVEARDPASGDLLAMWSIPHRRLDSFERSLSEATEKLRDWFVTYVAPF